MDQTLSSRKDELKVKARALLQQARYASPANIYTMNAVIESDESTEVDLEELCTILEEHNQKYEANFTEYKKEVDEALKEYFQSMAKTTSATSTPNASAPKNV